MGLAAASVGLASSRRGPGRPSTGVLEALQLGGAHNLGLGGGSLEDLGLVQGDRRGWPRHRWGWPRQ